MKELEISNRLRAISTADWKEVFKKCYGHVDLKLRNKTLAGAHCEQRLGMRATDYYVGNAYKALFEQSWEWQYEKYDILTQMTRVINSMISNEVRKYKAEQKQNKQLPLLIENDTFDGLMVEEPEEDILDTQYWEKCSKALDQACQDNPRYEEFVKLKINGKGYDEIINVMQCTLDEAYQMMETIARRARKLLTVEKQYKDDI